MRAARTAYPIVWRIMDALEEQIAQVLAEKED